MKIKIEGNAYGDRDWIENFVEQVIKHYDFNDENLEITVDCFTQSWGEKEPAYIYLHIGGKMYYIKINNIPPFGKNLGVLMDNRVVHYELLDDRFRHFQILDNGEITTHWG